MEPQGQSILNTSKKLIQLGAKNSGKHPIKALVDIDDIPALPAAEEPSSEEPAPEPENE